jgi:hypothetical protein
MENLKLNNGEIAKYAGADFWYRPTYLMEDGTTVCCVNLNGTFLHTISPEGEPDSPLKEGYQPVS